MVVESRVATKSCHLNESSVNYVKNNNKPNKKSNRNMNDRSGRSLCSHCGWKNHESSQCKFRNSKCHGCGKIGHLKSICRVKSTKSINYVSDNDRNCDTNDINSVFDFSVFRISNDKSCDTYSLSVIIDGITMKATCDTSAPCTLLSENFLKHNGINKPLRECTIPYVDYSGDRIEILGEYNSRITNKGNTKDVVIVVSKSNCPPLLGRTFLRTFNFELVQINTINDANENCEKFLIEIENEF